MHGESPAFVKAYDLLKWLLPATAKFPKQQRFVLARRVLEQQPDESADVEPQQQHAGQSEQQHRVPLRE